MVNLLSLSLVLIGAFITAVAALFVKMGMDIFSFKKLFKNFHLILGLCFYFFSTMIYVIALRGENLSVLFPIASTTYIWSNFFSVKFLGEKMNIWKWYSVFGIVLGVLLIGLGS